MRELSIIIFTLIIYSAISTVSYIVSKENDDVLAFFGLGIVGWIVVGFCWVVRKIKHSNSHRDKRSIIKIEETGEHRWCHIEDADDIYFWHQGYKLIERYATKEKWRKLQPFNKDFVEKCKRNCDRCIHDEKECISDGIKLCKDMNSFENFKIRR